MLFGSVMFRIDDSAVLRTPYSCSILGYCQGNGVITQRALGQIGVTSSDGEVRIPFPPESPISLYCTR